MMMKPILLLAAFVGVSLVSVEFIYFVISFKITLHSDNDNLIIAPELRIALKMPTLNIH